MSKFTNPLANVQVASPCAASWDEMSGDGRQRFCGECKLNVYNLSGMTKSEAENLLSNAEGHLCVRFYRRADGTVLTENCPIGWQAVKRKVSRAATGVFSFIVGLFGGLGAGAAFDQIELQPTMGKIAIKQTLHEDASDELIKTSKLNAANVNKP